MISLYIRKFKCRKMTNPDNMVSPVDLRERLRPAVKDYAETLQKKAEEQEIQHRSWDNSSYVSQLLQLLE